MPIAYYPTFLRYHLPDTTDFNFFHFWWHTLTIGPWPSGPAWFLWVLLAFDAIAALVWSIAPRAIEALGKPIYALRYRPGVAFVAFLRVLDHRLSADAPDRSATRAWFEPGRFPLPIQTSRIVLYSGYFLVGIGIGAIDLTAGLLAREQRIGEPLEDLACLRGCCSTVRSCCWSTPTTTGSPTSTRRRCRGGWLRARLRAVQRARWRSRSRRSSCASRKPRLRLLDAMQAVGLWHLPGALHLHHLAAIRGLRSAAGRPSSNSRSCSPARWR